MTNEEVMRAFGIYTHRPAYDRDAEATVEFLEDTIEIWKIVMAEEAFEKQTPSSDCGVMAFCDDCPFYKYRWHDLRKNPEDLPERYNRPILTISGEITNPIRASYTTIKQNGDLYNKDFLPRGLFDWLNGVAESITIDGVEFQRECFKVIAWRYIEPFEEVE